MTKERFTDMIRYFQKFFPNYLKTDKDVQEKADMYYEFFEDEEVEVVYKAFILCIKKKPFFPDVHDLITSTQNAKWLIQSKKSQTRSDRLYDPNYTLEGDWVFQVGVKAGF